MNKNDWILAAAVAAAAAFFFLFRSAGIAETPSGEVEVSQDGIVTASYPLDEDRQVVIESIDGGKNILVIRDGQVYFSEADCPDRLCVRQGKIGKNGEALVCLPHKLVLTVRSGEKMELDAVVN